MLQRAHAEVYGAAFTTWLPAPKTTDGADWPQRSASPEEAATPTGAARSAAGGAVPVRPERVAKYDPARMSTNDTAITGVSFSPRTAMPKPTATAGLM